MKILCLVVVLICVHYCSAAANRSTFWSLVNVQLYSNNLNYQDCGFTGLSSTATSQVLLSTSSFSIAAGITALNDAQPLAMATVGVINTLTIKFYYNSSYYLTLTLPAAPLAVAGTTVNSYLTASTVSNYITASTSLYPAVGSNTYTAPNGKTWLTIYNIPDVWSTYVAATTTLTGGIIILDSITSSSYAITHWADTKNSFYMLGFRTLYSSITGASGYFMSGCTSATGRKRSLDHFEHIIAKRAFPQTCPSSSIDTTLSSTTLSNMCTNIKLRCNTAVGCTGTVGNGISDSTLQDAMTKGVTATNALTLIDNLVFSAASSKFLIAANFGVFITISSIIFSSLF